VEILKNIIFGLLTWTRVTGAESSPVITANASETLYPFLDLLIAGRGGTCTGFKDHGRVGSGPGALHVDTVITDVHKVPASFGWLRCLSISGHRKREKCKYARASHRSSSKKDLWRVDLDAPVF